MPILIPNTKAPELRVATVQGEVFDLYQRDATGGFLVMFYRGLHSSRCGLYLEALNRNMSEFASRGIEVIAVSGDSKARAEQAFDSWDVSRLLIGYGQKVSSMFDWGLFVSRSAHMGEPQVFAEPGLFLIRRDHTLAFAIIHSLPICRPRISDLLKATDEVLGAAGVTQPVAEFASE